MSALYFGFPQPTPMPRPAQAAVRTRQEARSWLDSRGLSIAEFARANGLDRMTVCDVLRGKTKGLRGAAHDAAVALGLKRGVRRAEAR